MDAPDFSDVQRTETSNIMTQAMKIYKQTQAARRVFRPEDVGYFSPNPQANNDNVYYDIFSFTDRLRLKANSIDADVMRQNINACLLGTAKDWYDNKLDRLSKSMLFPNNRLCFAEEPKSWPPARPKCKSESDELAVV